jgi:tetrahydromethanopterin S-methyltransferase subunit G
MDRQVAEYFMQVTKERFDGIEQRFNRIDDKLDQVVSFRWQIIGGSLALSSVLSVVIAIVTIYYTRTR